MSTVSSQIFEALFGTGKPHSRETGTKLGSEGREQRQWPCFWPGIQLGAPWAFLWPDRPIKNSEHFSTRCVMLVTWGVCVCVCARICVSTSALRHLGLGGSSWWGRLVHWRTGQQPWPLPPPCQYHTPQPRMTTNNVSSGYPVFPGEQTTPRRSQVSTNFQTYFMSPFNQDPFQFCTKIQPF